MQDICLFAHFDKDDKVDEYVLRYLGKIKELNFSVVFISASRLCQADVERLGAICFDVILRENKGLDFGSWSAGFAKHGSEIGGRLLLANDSVYGPLGDLADALDRLTQKPADFYGMVESTQTAPHLQSWFLLFEPWVARSAEFKAILAQPFSALSRKSIIAKGEVGLSRRLVRAGFRYRALYLASQAGLAVRLDAINPMHLLWRELLFEERIPFLKIELLRDNPLGVEDAGTILRAAERINPDLCGIARSHLARTGNPDPLRRARRPFAGRYRFAMIRKGYRLEHENRRLAAAWNLVKLETLVLPVQAWRLLRSLVGTGPELV